MKVLITGGTGFVGSNLTDYLSRSPELEITIMSRKDLKSVNVLDLNGYSVIVHLAGMAHDLKNVATPKSYYDVNFELTKNLFDAFLTSDVNKFIFISSVKAALDKVSGILSEEVVPSPSTHYGKSKLMAERYIEEQSLSKGKSNYILRPCMIHGPGNKGNLNLLYNFVQKGIPYPLAAFNNNRSFLSIENLCFVIKELIFQNIYSGIYNVADDETLSTNEVIKLVAEASNSKLRLWKLPMALIRNLAIFGDRFKLPLNSEILEKLTEDYIVDNRKIKSALQKNLPVDVIEGLIKTVQSFNNTVK